VTATVEDRIQALVIKWLEVNRGIEAKSARIDEDDWAVRRGYSSGCDTCGFGSDPDYMELTIWYQNTDDISGYVELAMNPLTFLAELLTLEDVVAA
jgi:hypothetical protein